jgi:hypothetical protein
MRARARIVPLASLSIVALAAPLFVAMAACGSRDGDPPSTGVTPNPLGSGSRIRDIADPTLPHHPATNTQVTVTGASYTWTDTFDETANGKSKGTLYLQDVAQGTGGSPPYSGASVFSPTFSPANLKPSPGDILDLVGTWQENTNIGTAVFTPPDVLPQISKPTVTPRFEYTVPPATAINLLDLNAYPSGRQWMSMIVTLQNVTFGDDLTDDGNGRDTAYISPDMSKNGVTVSNELFDLAAWNTANGKPITKGQTIKSLTGIVTWFYSFHVAPRTPADIEVK